MTLSKQLVVLSYFTLFLFLLNTSGIVDSSTSQNLTSGYRLAQSDVNVVDYLIITTEDFESAVQPLAIWKMQRGLISAIETAEDISENYEGEDLADKIRNCIIDYHTNHETLWVVLAGGYVIPTRSVRIGDTIVSCDSYYSNLDDNWDLGYMSTVRLNDADDWEPEVYVGRLPADTESQLVDLVTRLIQYEQNPPIGPWMEQAVYAGTFCNFNYDLDGNNIFDENDFPEFDTNRNHNWMKSNLLPENWTSTLLAETEGIKTTDYPYDFQLNETSLVTAINSGASIVMADAHGSTNGMYRTTFTNDVDGDLLFDSGVDRLGGGSFITTTTDFDVNGKYGFYFLAACSTGTFSGHECLTEYIVRTSGIGCIGSSHSSGYDPFMFTDDDGEHLGWTTQGLSERVWEQILVEGNNRPGMALALAKDDYSIDRVLLNGDYDSGKTMAQYNLMGDPEVPLWIGIPSSFELPTVDSNEDSREIVIRTGELQSMMNEATITLHGSSYYQRFVSSTGDVIFNMPDLVEAENMTITISKDGYIPLQIEIEIPAGSLSIDYVPLVGVVALVSLVLVITVWYKIKKP